MILDEYVTIKIGSNNAAYWRNKNYILPPVGGRADKNGHHEIQVKVSDLPLNSNIRVNCECDHCKAIYTNRYGRAKELCGTCRSRNANLGNTHGVGHKGRSLQGKDHPRWNPNKTAMIAYSRRVHWLTKKNYEKHKDVINPLNYPRALCGTEGGYQLDHKVSIKEGFLTGIPPEILADPINLQMLPWRINRTKW